MAVRGAGGCGDISGTWVSQGAAHRVSLAIALALTVLAALDTVHAIPRHQQPDAILHPTNASSSAVAVGLASLRCADVAPTYHAATGAYLLEVRAHQERVECELAPRPASSSLVVGGTESDDGHAVVQLPSSLTVVDIVVGGQGGAAYRLLIKREIGDELAPDVPPKSLQASLFGGDLLSSLSTSLGPPEYSTACTCWEVEAGPRDDAVSVEATSNVAGAQMMLFADEEEGKELVSGESSELFSIPPASQPPLSLEVVVWAPGHKEHRTYRLAVRRAVDRREPTSSCPSNCSGPDHGECVNGVCVCAADFTSEDCSVPLNQRAYMNVSNTEAEDQRAPFVSPFSGSLARGEDYGLAECADALRSQQPPAVRADGESDSFAPPECDRAVHQCMLLRQSSGFVYHDIERECAGLVWAVARATEGDDEKNFVETFVDRVLPPSTDCSVLLVEVCGGRAIAFDPTQSLWEAEVDEGVDTASVTVVVASSSHPALSSIPLAPAPPSPSFPSHPSFSSSPLSLLPGPNRFVLSNLAHDATTECRDTVLIHRMYPRVEDAGEGDDANSDAHEAKASHVWCESGMNEEFDPEVLDYSCKEVAYTDAHTVVGATALGGHAFVSVGGQAVSAGAPTTQVPLVPGNNRVRVEVRAFDGSRTIRYSLSIPRALPPSLPSLSSSPPLQSNPFLSALVVSPTLASEQFVRLTPTFSPETLAYSAWVLGECESVRVKLQPVDKKASASVNKTPVAPLVSSSALPLLAGPNTLTVVVVGSDAVTSATYTVVIHRPYPKHQGQRSPSQNARLKELDVGPGYVLSPDFSPLVTRYTVEANSLTQLTVKATPEDSHAFMSANNIALVPGSRSPELHLAPPAQGEDGSANDARDMPAQHLHAPLPSGVVVTVVAEDTVSSLQYVVEVVAGTGHGAHVVNILPSVGSLEPEFDPSLHEYLVVVPPPMPDSMFLLIDAPQAVLLVDGLRVHSGRPSQLLTLHPNDSQPSAAQHGGVLVVVEAVSENREHTATYRLEVVSDISTTPRPVMCASGRVPTTEDAITHCRLGPCFRQLVEGVAPSPTMPAACEAAIGVRYRYGAFPVSSQAPAQCACSARCRSPEDCSGLVHHCHAHTQAVTFTSDEALLVEGLNALRRMFHALDTEYQGVVKAEEAVRRGWLANADEGEELTFEQFVWRVTDPSQPPPTLVWLDPAALPVVRHVNVLWQRYNNGQQTISKQELGQALVGDGFSTDVALAAVAAIATNPKGRVDFSRFAAGVGDNTVPSHVIVHEHTTRMQHSLKHIANLFVRVGASAEMGRGGRDRVEQGMELVWGEGKWDVVCDVLDAMGGGSGYIGFRPFLMAVKAGLLPGLHPLSPPSEGLHQALAILPPSALSSLQMNPSQPSPFVSFVRSLRPFAADTPLHAEFARFLEQVVDADGNGALSEKEVVRGVAEGVIRRPEDWGGWMEVYAHFLSFRSLPSADGPRVQLEGMVSGLEAGGVPLRYALYVAHTADLALTKEIKFVNFLHACESGLWTPLHLHTSLPLSHSLLHTHLVFSDLRPKNGAVSKTALVDFLGTQQGWGSAVASYFVSNIPTASSFTITLQELINAVNSNLVSLHALAPSEIEGQDAPLHIVHLWLSLPPPSLPATDAPPPSQTSPSPPDVPRALLSAAELEKRLWRALAPFGATEYHVQTILRGINPSKSPTLPPTSLPPLLLLLFKASRLPPFVASLPVSASLPSVPSLVSGGTLDLEGLVALCLYFEEFDSDRTMMVDAKELTDTLHQQGLTEHDTNLITHLLSLSPGPSAPSSAPSSLSFSAFVRAMEFGLLPRTREGAAHVHRTLQQLRQSFQSMGVGKDGTVESAVVIAYAKRRAMPAELLPVLKAHLGAKVDLKTFALACVSGYVPFPSMDPPTLASVLDTAHRQFNEVVRGSEGGLVIERQSLVQVLMNNGYTMPLARVLAFAADVRGMGMIGRADFARAVLEGIVLLHTADPFSHHIGHDHAAHHARSITTEYLVATAQAFTSLPISLTTFSLPVLELTAHLVSSAKIPLERARVVAAALALPGTDGSAGDDVVWEGFLRGARGRVVDAHGTGEVGLMVEMWQELARGEEHVEKLRLAEVLIRVHALPNCIAVAVAMALSAHSETVVDFGVFLRGFAFGLLALPLDLTHALTVSSVASAFTEMFPEQGEVVGERCLQVMGRMELVNKDAAMVCAVATESDKISLRTLVQTLHRGYLPPFAPSPPLRSLPSLILAFVEFGGSDTGLRESSLRTALAERYNVPEPIASAVARLSVLHSLKAKGHTKPEAGNAETDEDGDEEPDHHGDTDTDREADDEATLELVEFVEVVNKGLVPMRALHAQTAHEKAVLHEIELLCTRALEEADAAEISDEDRQRSRDVVRAVLAKSGFGGYDQRVVMADHSLLDVVEVLLVSVFSAFGDSPATLQESITPSWRPLLAIVKAFGTFDIEKEGSITRRDMVTQLMAPDKLHQKLSYDDAETVFSVMDFDHSDSVDVVEYAYAWNLRVMPKWKNSGESARVALRMQAAKDKFAHLDKGMAGVVGVEELAMAFEKSISDQERATVLNSLARVHRVGDHPFMLRRTEFLKAVYSGIVPVEHNEFADLEALEWIRTTFAEFDKDSDKQWSQLEFRTYLLSLKIPDEVLDVFHTAAFRSRSTSEPGLVLEAIDLLAFARLIMTGAIPDRPLKAPQHESGALVEFASCYFSRSLSFALVGAGRRADLTACDVPVIEVDLPPKAEVCEGASLTLVFRAHHARNFEWSKNGVAMDDAVQSENDQLLIETATTAHSGVYRCTASNRWGAVQSQECVVTVAKCNNHTKPLSESTPMDSLEDQGAKARKAEAGGGGCDCSDVAGTLAAVDEWLGIDCGNEGKLKPDQEGSLQCTPEAGPATDVVVDDKPVRKVPVKCSASGELVVPSLNGAVLADVGAQRLQCARCDTGELDGWQPVEDECPLSPAPGATCQLTCGKDGSEEVTAKCEGKPGAFKYTRPSAQC